MQRWNMERIRSLRRQLIAFVTLMTLALLSCNSTTPPQPSTTQAHATKEPVEKPANAPPPLVIDMDEPLLLDAPPGEEQVLSGTTGADNAQCFVCHANYMGESLASRHAEIGMGCAACHGESLAHKNDENNTTPPETLFPTENIDRFCRRCHSSHDVAPSKVVARWLKSGTRAPMLTSSPVLSVTAITG